jgi:hypothetical protein
VGSHKKKFPFLLRAFLKIAVFIDLEAGNLLFPWAVAPFLPAAPAAIFSLPVFISRSWRHGCFHLFALMSFSDPIIAIFFGHMSRYSPISALFSLDFCAIFTQVLAVCAQFLDLKHSTSCYFSPTF